MWSTFVEKRHCACTGRNRLTANSWLGAHNPFERLNRWGGAAWLSGLIEPWHSFLNRFAGCASCPEACLAQPSNLGLGQVPELAIPAPLRCGEGKGNPEWYGQKDLTHPKKSRDLCYFVFIWNNTVVNSHLITRRLFIRCAFKALIGLFIRIAPTSLDSVSDCSP